MSKKTSSTPATPPRDSLTLGHLLGDVRLLLILHIAFRVLLALTFEPILTAQGERGITVGGDFLYYYQLGGLTVGGNLPFRDWWSEFPPIPSHLITLVYAIAGRSYGSFALVFGLLMLACDVGILLLIRRIGTRLHGANTGMALAWVYALLFAPAVFLWWTHESLVMVFFLLSLAALVEGRNTASALWAAVGGLSKFTPLLILGAVWRYRARTIQRSAVAVRYTAVVVAIFGAVYLFFFARNAAMTLPSLTAQFSKPSYQTVWALLDGNLRTGNFGPAEDRRDPANAAVFNGNPAVVPGWLRLGAAALIGLFVFARTRRFDSRGLVAFVAITLLIFFLQAQGWSPQWLVQIVPLLLLAIPTRDTVIACVLLIAVSFAEYPFLFLRTGDTGGAVSGALVTPFTVLIMTRTAILVGFCLALYRRLRADVPADMPVQTRTPGRS